LKKDREKFSKEKKDELDKLNSEIAAVRDDKIKKKQNLEEEKKKTLLKMKEEHDKMMEDLQKKIDETTKQFHDLKQKNQTQEK
jgi:dsDNA-specific endonuclease/ATPase MutS2